MATIEKTSPRVEGKPPTTERTTNKMAITVDGKHNSSTKLTLGDTKLNAGRTTTRSFPLPMSLKNLKADLTAASSSISNSDFPEVEERVESKQNTNREVSDEQHLYHQEKGEGLCENSTRALHRPESDSHGGDEQNHHAISEASSRNVLAPLWTEGFAKGVTNSVKRSVDDIISHGSLLQTPKRKFWSSLTPEDILRPSSYGSEEDEEEYILGSGSFSKVIKVHIKQSDGNHRNSTFALKHLKGDLLPSKLTENSCKNGSVIAFTKAATELAREAILLSQFDHPHIINILGWTDGGVNSYSTYRRHDAYFLVLELLQEETLDDRIERWNQDDEYLRSVSCSEDKRKVQFHRRKMEQLTICRQVASALEYLHSKNVVYRDLKPQNIGFARNIDNAEYDCEGNVVVKLMDFGLARELPPSGTLHSFSGFEQHRHNPLLFDMTGTVGTIRYMAPEVCMNRPYGLECDIYSWSIVAHEILSQTKPYDDMTPGMYQSLVCQQGVRPPTQNMPSEHIVLLTQAWRTDPSKRLPFSRIKRQLDLFLQQEKLIWEAQELISDMPERCESPIVLTKSFAEENFGIQNSSTQSSTRSSIHGSSHSSSHSGARRGNKRSWYRANNDDNYFDRDSRKSPIFPDVSEPYHREHHARTEYIHSQSYEYNHHRNTSPRNTSVYHQSPPPRHYEATRSPHRRRPQPVTPDRHWNRQQQGRHEQPTRNYYHHGYNNNNHSGHHHHDHYDNHHHRHRGSEHRHRDVRPRNVQEHWGNVYY